MIISLHIALSLSEGITYQGLRHYPIKAVIPYNRPTTATATANAVPQMMVAKPLGFTAPPWNGVPL